MSVRMKRWVACSEEGQELGKCSLKLRFLTHWLMGIWWLCPLPRVRGRPRWSLVHMPLGAFVLRFRVGDILGKSLIEELQVLFVEENLQLGFHRVNEMPGAEAS